MSKTGASPEFERKMQEIGAKYAHMMVPRSNIERPWAEMEFPEAPHESRQVIPEAAVNVAAKWLHDHDCRSAVHAGHPADFECYGWLDEARELLEAAAPHMPTTPATVAMGGILETLNQWFNGATSPDQALNTIAQISGGYKTEEGL
jgi:hypothetical protein